MATTEIQDLAQIIAYNTAIYNHYLQANSLPTPSHYVQPPERPVRLPDEIEAARSAALEASHELHELLSGSVGHILNAAARVNSSPFQVQSVETNTSIEHAYNDPPLSQNLSCRL